jgi:hypothetical protein
MTGEGNEMTPSIAKVNGTGIAYRVEGTGPPLVLVMGYRLSFLAWPAAFVEALASQFMVITMDNRGTGRSDKPVQGYALANMARDVCGLLDELEIPRAHCSAKSNDACPHQARSQRCRQGEDSCCSGFALMAARWITSRSYC